VPLFGCKPIRPELEDFTAFLGRAWDANFKGNDESLASPRNQWNHKLTSQVLHQTSTSWCSEGPVTRPLGVLRQEQARNLAHSLSLLLRNSMGIDVQRCRDIRVPQELLLHLDVGTESSQKD